MHFFAMAFYMLKSPCMQKNILIGFEQMWSAVPITIATSKKDNALTFVLEKESDTVVLEGVGPEEWILVGVACDLRYSVL